MMRIKNEDEDGNVNEDTPSPRWILVKIISELRFHIDNYSSYLDNYEE